METIILTASAGAFSGLADALGKIHVLVEERPLVSFQPPHDWSDLDAALTQRSRYGSVALTSPRAAAAVVQRLRACGISWTEGVSPPVWTVGRSTTAALQDTLGSARELDPLKDPDKGAAERLAYVMLDAGAEGPVLFPCGDRHRDELTRVLRGNGIEVEEIVCYRAVLASPSQARAAVAGSSMVVVASPSVVELLAEACFSAVKPSLVAVGPSTAAAARAAGWPPAAIASAPSTQALATAITGLLTNR